MHAHRYVCTHVPTMREMNLNDTPLITKAHSFQLVYQIHSTGSFALLKSNIGVRTKDTPKTKIFPNIL